MSMNFSEFKRLLGAEPRSTDPELLRARHSSPEFEQAALEAEQFEEKLERAAAIPAPDGLLDDIKAISSQARGPSREKGWWPMALAASVLIAVGAAGMAWNMNRGWDSVEEYLVDHYRHDGEKMAAMAGSASTGEVQSVLSQLNVQASPVLADIVGVIKYCPTPDGKGVHMVLNTENGPVTVIYMPETEVTDREMLAFDDVEALLVDLQKGSAAIIGPGTASVTGLYAVVHDSILPSPGNS
jgi:hypothetical protein